VAYKKESFEMFETMMMQFQQDTARHLFRMQIIGPDGKPIESIEQMPPRVDAPVTPVLPALPRQPRLPMDIGGTPQAGDGSATARQPVPVPTRAPSTTIDELEREFQRKKKRELEQARVAGASASSNGNAPRVTGEKVGRNDPCPCGSGKKYKKCHGAQA
jgi:preprotein translocase subunit SecA